MVLFSSLHTLETYGHYQKVCPFASLEVQSQLCTFAAQSPVSTMIRQLNSATLGDADFFPCTGGLWRKPETCGSWRLNREIACALLSPQY